MPNSKRPLRGFGAAYRAELTALPWCLSRDSIRTSRKCKWQALLDPLSHEGGGGVHLPEWSSFTISVRPFEETPGERTNKDFAHSSTVNFTSEGVDVRRHAFLSSELAECNVSRICHQNITVFWGARENVDQNPTPRGNVTAVQTTLLRGSTSQPLHGKAYTARTAHLTCSLLQHGAEGSNPD